MHKSALICHLSTAIATGLYVGKFPKAPGTMGSLATFIVVYLLSLLLHLTIDQMLLLTGLMLFIVAILYAAGVWATTQYMARTQREDPKEVVIDEIAGQWLSLTLSAPIFIWVGEFASWEFILVFGIINFGFFRFFDIKKKGPVRWADQTIEGAHGVMLDDIFAGIFAGISTFIVLFAYLNI